MVLPRPSAVPTSRLPVARLPVGLNGLTSCKGPAIGSTGAGSFRPSPEPSRSTPSSSYADNILSAVRAFVVGVPRVAPS